VTLLSVGKIEEQAIAGEILIIHFVKYFFCPKYPFL
jgi:hypothetical protein